MSDGPQGLNLFFRLTVVAGAVFIMTVLALLAVIFGNPEAPVAKFLHEYGGRLIAVEVAATLLIGLLAMAVDRRQILRQLMSDEASQISDTDSTGAGKPAADKASS